MEAIFYISIAFFLFYFILFLKPRMLTGIAQIIAGFSYFIFCILFLIVIYLINLQYGLSC